ncbi:hypothetical protein [Streptomyces sp. NPDC056524]|uniref:hypothetical protein n=1 Tax=Streptomyces sp. NPDC056524 TaxID=3345851 RepID=UPI0036CD616D
MASVGNHLNGGRARTGRAPRARLLCAFRPQAPGLFPELLAASPYAAEVDEAVVTEPPDDHSRIRMHTG